jgi:Predicted periplasmic ligand-binding sensor domain
LLDANLTRHTCRETHFVVSAILLLAVIVCCAAARAEIPPQVKFKPILTNKLEKLGYINDILQDKEGFLWFGAIQGLARYDGYTVKTYLHNVDDPHSLSHNWVKSLLLDNNGQLWAVTYSGLCQYLDQNAILTVSNSQGPHPKQFLRII